MLTFYKVVGVFLVACDTVRIVEGTVSLDNIVTIKTSSTLKRVDVLKINE